MSILLCFLFIYLILISLEVLNDKRETLSATGTASGKKLPNTVVADLLSSGNG